MEEESIKNFYLSSWTSQDRSWKEGFWKPSLFFIWSLKQKNLFWTGLKYQKI